MADVPDAIRERDLSSRPVEPVVVAWEGQVAELEVTLPHPSTSGLVVEVTLEDGSAWPLSHESLTSDPWKRTEIDGMAFAKRTFPLAGLPPGYHRVEVMSGRVGGSAVVISAPRKCAPVGARNWGVFLPLHAIRSAQNWGCGDLSDLAELRSWAGSLGATTVGTLPLLSAFLDRPYEPSPYSPVSRLFWNEVFIDVERVPELERSRPARELCTSPGFRREVERARRTRLVDYRAVASLKRRVLEHLARAFHQEPDPERGARFGSYRNARPDLVPYARFRAACERHEAGWRDWPPGRGGTRIPERDLDPDVVRYHQYVQWVAEEQLAEAARHGAPGEGLYLDLPLGVYSGGYDTWRYRGAFAHGFHGGAPPDMFFPNGQDWGFPPPHPDGIRAGGYEYFRAALRNLLRHAGVLRIDHVMGLHRLYWVPPGMDAASGVYVRYRPEELYAILALESQRTGTAIVGEDLGTVPPPVRPAMARHGVLRSHVLQLEAQIREDPLPEPVPESLASLNTHDMPTFAAFWEEIDVELRRELSERLRRRGLLRGGGTGAAMLAALHYLAAGPSRMMVVTLEDLWLETEPQNRPGTGPEQPNWRRKAARSWDSIRMDQEIAGTLEGIDRLRHP